MNRRDFLKLAPAAAVVAAVPAIKADPLKADPFAGKSDEEILSLIREAQEKVDNVAMIEEDNVSWYAKGGEIRITKMLRKDYEGTDREHVPFWTVYDQRLRYQMNDWDCSLGSAVQMWNRRMSSINHLERRITLEGLVRGSPTFP